MNFLNENDPKAAAWLRELMRKGEIPPGTVDERSITNVQPNDLLDRIQCHFFAGIGGWPLALRLAGWPEAEPVWTGSCPCQPFSDAGKGLGEADPRHLWPAWFRHIRECRPGIIFGEQVASKAALGWLDGVFTDLEAEGYACGANDLCAAGVGEKIFQPQAAFLRWLVQRGDDRVCGRRDEVLAFADELEGIIAGSPHIRQRIYWVADSNAGRLAARGGIELQKARAESRGRELEQSGGARGLADKQSQGWPGVVPECQTEQRERPRTGRDSTDGGLADATELPGTEHGSEPGQREMPGPADAAECGGPAIGMEHADEHRRFAGQPTTTAARHGDSLESTGGDCRLGNAAGHNQRRKWKSGEISRWPSTDRGSGPWSNFDFIPCRDNKSRRVESGTFPLVARLPGGMVPSGTPSITEAQASAEARVMRLKGYGNSIIPQLAAEFIKAFLDTKINTDA